MVVKISLLLHSESRRRAWRRAAIKCGESMQEWIRRNLDAAAGYTHPKKPSKSPFADKRIVVTMCEGCEQALSVGGKPNRHCRFCKVMLAEENHNVA